MEKETNKSIKEAKKELEEISSDEREQRLAELRQKYIMDQNAIREAGYDKGFSAGIEQKNIEIVKNLKKKNMNIDFIMEVTGLTKEEIDKIK